jgi:hypothetical protein
LAERRAQRKNYKAGAGRDWRPSPELLRFHGHVALQAAVRAQRLPNMTLQHAKLFEI